MTARPDCRGSVACIQMPLEIKRAVSRQGPFPRLAISRQIFSPNRACVVELWISGIIRRDDAEDNASYNQIAPPNSAELLRSFATVRGLPARFTREKRPINCTVQESNLQPSAKGNGKRVLLNATLSQGECFLMLAGLLRFATVAL